MLRRDLLGLGLMGMLPRTWAAAPPSLDAQLAAIVSDPACPLASLSVLAIRNGAIRYEQQCGYRNIAAGLRADAHTLYRIASVSKLVTTLGLMRLLEDGKVALDQDVATYLGFPLRNPAFPQQPITLRMLLSHTSSLRDDAGYSFPLSSSLRDVITPAMWSPRAAPGAYFTYCNLGWGIIGTIMERVTGERFDRLMQRLILAPLGLGGGYNVAELAPPERANLATLYRKRTVDTEVWNLQGPWIAQADDVHAAAPLPGIASYTIGTNATPFSPTGGLRVTAHDLGVLMLMLMNGGVHQGRRILQASTLHTMFARAWTDTGTNGDTLHGLYHAWGLGNQQFPRAAPLVDGIAFDAAGHLGDAYGLRAIFACDLAKRCGMVVLIGGSGADPDTRPARHSALAGFEEDIVTALYRRAILDA
jgi:CubicO group peptidase (beta-lactamase class C family)